MSNANTGKIVRFTLDPANPPALSEEAKARLDALKDENIDFSDIPELTPEFWSGVQSDQRNKSQITLRLDADVLDYFRASGSRYQTRINDVLRAFMQAHTPPRQRSAKR